jgi:dTDP-4-amino-4,6-dideoxygalactose transaminase
MAYLRQREIETSINYIPNHFHPYYRRDGLSLPNTERAYAEILTLPLHCALTDDDVTRVIETVTAFYGATP